MSDRRTFLRPIPILAAASLLVGLAASPTLAAPPSNDDRGDATVIGALPYHDSSDTSEATPQDADPDCSSGPDDPTVWYSFTPAVSGRYGVSTYGSDYDTTLLVATPNGGGLDIVDCNDDTSGVASAVIWQATAGQEYLIMAGSCCGELGGDLELLLRKDPRRVRVTDVTIAATGTVNRQGGAVIRGRVECQRPAGADGFLSLRARQEAGRFFIRGGNEVGLRCDRQWSVRVRGDIGRFAPGRVAVAVEAFVCSAFGCDGDTGRRTVRLVAP